MPRALNRLPRFKRVVPDRIPFEVQARDKEIVKLAYDYRFLTSEQICRLVPGSDQVILRRLQKLFHGHYLDRFKISNNDPILYALGNKGADELAQFGIERGKLDWAKKNSEVKDRYLAHTQMIANFRCILTLAVANQKELEVIRWQPEAELKDEVYFQDKKGKKVRAPIVPDGFFTLRAGSHQLHFFLEADRSTMTNSRFLQKMKGYWNYRAKAKKYMSKNIGYRVLTITKSQARAENLRRTSRQADSFKSGSSMFWFTHEGLFDMENPKTILGDIWATSGDGNLHHLLE